MNNTTYLSPCWCFSGILDAIIKTNKIHLEKEKKNRVCPYEKRITTKIYILFNNLDTVHNKIFIEIAGDVKRHLLRPLST